MTARARRRRGLIWQPPRDLREDPGNRDRAMQAREQMRLFDRQPPEVRQAFAESRFGVPVNIIGACEQRGPNDAVRAALKERGVFACDVGTAGVVVETIRLLDDAEAEYLRSQVYR